jgi:DNA-binding LacI/PurR family transcriptional regulator
MGALLALHQRGIRVPAEVSVVGFDDVPEAAYTIPPLTTVRVEFALQGRTAVDGLVDQIEGNETPVTAAVGQPSRVSLAVRDSSVPPAPA